MIKNFSLKQKQTKKRATGVGSMATNTRALVTRIIRYE